jgi:hypothetical protein
MYYFSVILDACRRRPTEEKSRVVSNLTILDNPHLIFLFSDQGVPYTTLFSLCVSLICKTHIYGIHTI